MPSNPLTRTRKPRGRPKGSKDRQPRGAKLIREVLALRLPRDLSDEQQKLADQARAVLERATRPHAGYSCASPRCVAATMLLIALGAHPADAADLIADVEVQD